LYSCWLKEYPTKIQLTARGSNLDTEELLSLKKAVQPNNFGGTENLFLPNNNSQGDLIPVILDAVC
jgi:hypothetical protein